MSHLKIALISYHKNISSIYPEHWINRHKQSVINQTHKQFDIFELEYGGGNYRLFENSIYESKHFTTFVHAMNYLIDKAFSLGYDFVGNLNADDWYALNRLDIQIPYLLEGFDLVSSNFSLIKDDKITHQHKFHSLDIQEQLNYNHNPVAHPSVFYSSHFWKNNRYDPSEIPFEDLKLWQRAIKNSKFYICEENLLFHRIHSNSVCQSSNR